MLLPLLFLVLAQSASAQCTTKLSELPAAPELFGFRLGMTKEQVKNRPQSNYPDFYNLFAFMFGAPERVNATVTGLDSLNAQLQTSMVSATPNIRAKLLQAILGVSAVSGMGKPVAGDAASKSYDVVFGAQGNVIVNGTDLGALMNTTAQPAAGMPVLR